MKLIKTSKVDIQKKLLNSKFGCFTYSNEIRFGQVVYQGCGKARMSTTCKRFDIRNRSKVKPNIEPHDEFYVLFGGL